MNKKVCRGQKKNRGYERRGLFCTAAGREMCAPVSGAGPDEVIIGSRCPESLGWYNCHRDIWRAATVGCFLRLAQLLPLSKNRRPRQCWSPKLENLPQIMREKKFCSLSLSSHKRISVEEKMEEITFSTALIKWLYYWVSMDNSSLVTASPWPPFFFLVATPPSQYTVRLLWIYTPSCKICLPLCFGEEILMTSEPHLT